MFNKASAQISHAKEADGSLRISATSDSRQERVMLYKHFVKPGQEEKKDYSIRISDQELFLQCEGRTARKGARASQPGKISRTLDASTTDKVSKPKKSKAKKSKAKNE